MSRLPVFLFILALAASFNPIAAQDEAAPSRLALGLTDEEIQVTARFAGERIVVFGVARDLADDEDVVITLRGPSRPLQVSRKDKVAGVWVNGPPALLQGAPALYVIASTQPIRRIAPPGNLRRAQIGPNNIPLRTVGAGSAQFAGRIAEYRQAIIDAKTRKQLYMSYPDGVELLGAGLFRTSVLVPSGAPTGSYEATAYVFRNGQVQAQQAITLTVKRVGFERLVHDLARTAPLAYGLMAVLMALGAGWAAAAIFGRR